MRRMRTVLMICSAALLLVAGAALAQGSNQACSCTGAACGNGAIGGDQGDIFTGISPANVKKYFTGNPNTGWTCVVPAKIRGTGGPLGCFCAQYCGNGGIGADPNYFDLGLSQSTVNSSYGGGKPGNKTDNGSNLYIAGAYDTRWNNDVLNPAFASLKASDFEVVKLGWQPSSTPPAACVPGDTRLCLNGGRFQVEAQWTANGTSGAGHAVALTPDTGYFWFFADTNVEMVLKVLNACGFNQRYWVYAGGLTNVKVHLTVTDTQTGAVKTYDNPQGTAFRPIQDSGAFSTCP